MDEAQEELKPLTTVQLLDAAIWARNWLRPAQPPEAFAEALSRVLARWMLTRSQAPEVETLTTLCKTHAYVLNPERFEASTAASAGSEMQACVVSGFPREAL